MWRGGVCCVVFSVSWALACGGRYERDPPTSDAVGHAGSPASSSSGASGSSSGGAASGNGGQPAVTGGAGVMDVACAKQFIDYGDYRSQVVNEFAPFGCTIDTDCRSFYDQSACDPSCVPLTSAAFRGVLDRLNTFELLNCNSDCSPQPWVTCPAGAPGHCVSGSCQ
jgi:hypothetical protein